MIKKSFILLLILLPTCQLFAQTLRTVNLAFSGYTNYASITAALSGATSGTTICVAAGTYTEAELTVPLGVNVIGGFPTSATSLAQRIYPGTATTTQLTILNGNYKHRVATVYGTLDGCVITKGYVYDSTNTHPIYGAGGGVLIDGGTVQNCILHDNIAAKLTPSSSTIPGTFVASIGDIYCTDGTLLNPTYSLNASGQIVAALSGGIPSGKTPQGIIFYVDTSPTTKHFLIMGKPAATKWTGDFTFDVTILTDITDQTVASKDLNGNSNTQTIVNYVNTNFSSWSEWDKTQWTTTLSAVRYANEYNYPITTQGQWYLPAAAEIYQIWSVYPQMDACASSILGWISSGTSMFPKGIYWSSSEHDANNVWGLSTYSYPWGSWGLMVEGKTQGGYAIPVASKVLSTQ